MTQKIESIVSVFQHVYDSRAPKPSASEGHIHIKIDKGQISECSTEAERSSLKDIASSIDNLVGAGVLRKKEDITPLLNTLQQIQERIKTLKDGSKLSWVRNCVLFIFSCIYKAPEKRIDESIIKLQELNKTFDVRREAESKEFDEKEEKEPVSGVAPAEASSVHSGAPALRGSIALIKTWNEHLKTAGSHTNIALPTDSPICSLEDLKKFLLTKYMYPAGSRIEINGNPLEEWDFEGFKESLDKRPGNIEFVIEINRPPEVPPSIRPLLGFFSISTTDPATKEIAERTRRIAAPIHPPICSIHDFNQFLIKHCGYPEGSLIAVNGRWIEGWDFKEISDRFLDRHYKLDHAHHFLVELLPTDIIPALAVVPGALIGTFSRICTKNYREDHENSSSERRDIPIQTDPPICSVQELRDFILRQHGSPLGSKILISGEGVGTDVKLEDCTLQGIQKALNYTPSRIGLSFRVELPPG